MSDNKLIKVEAKEEAFIQAYVRCGFNGRKAMMTIKPGLTPESADTSASRLLRSVKVRQAILDKILPADKDLSLIKKALDAKLPDNIDWRDLHKFIETSLRLKGYSESEKKQHGGECRIGLIIED